MAFMAVQRTSHRLTIMLGKVPIRVVKVKRKKKKKKKRKNNQPKTSRILWTDENT